MSLTVLIVSGDPDLRSFIETALAQEGCECLRVPAAPDGKYLLPKRRVDLVVLDGGLAPGCARQTSSGGADLLDTIPVLVLTEVPEARCRFWEKGNGRCKFIARPIAPGRLLSIMRSLLPAREPRRSADGLSWVCPARRAFDRILGESPAIQEVRRQLEVLPDTDVSVLIDGETGTGKELVAQAIRLQSRRASGPWVPVNCSGLTETMADAELFGHEKGVFTGAIEAKPGLFELADGGTLFLDEVSEMPLAVQPKLLRVLDDGSLRRVGGRRDVLVDVRILAATNVDLEAAVRSGRFRKDLFYRLWDCTIHVPPLKDRHRDAVLLARRFLERFCRQFEKPPRRFSPDAVEFLLRHPWPGNVRELEKLVKRTVLLSPEGEITAVTLRERLRVAASGGETRPSSGRVMSREAERKHREAVVAVEEAGGNRSQAARDLGISPTTLRKRLREGGFSTPGS